MKWHWRQQYKTFEKGVERFALDTAPLLSTAVHWLDTLPYHRGHPGEDAMGGPCKKPHTVILGRCLHRQVPFPKELIAAGQPGPTRVSHSWELPKHRFPEETHANSREH